MKKIDFLHVLFAVIFFAGAVIALKIGEEIIGAICATSLVWLVFVGVWQELKD